MDAVMVYLNGHERPSFRCECGCNVFHREDDPAGRPDHHTYTCNACGAEYLGEA